MPKPAAVMSWWLHALCFASLLASNASAQQAAPSVDRFLTTEHGGKDGPIHTGLGSARERRDNQLPPLLHYEVCNRGGKNIVYNWHEPGFENSIAAPLMPQKCALYSVAAVKSSAADTSIRYFGMNQEYRATAYVPARTTWQGLRKDLETKLYTRGIGPGPRPPQQTLSDAKVVVTILVTQADGRLIYQISWDTQVGALALKLPATSEALRAQILSQLKSQLQRSNVLATADLLKTLVGEVRDGMKDSLGDGHFIHIVDDQGSPRAVKLAMPVADATSPSHQPLLVKDPKGQLLFLLQYATVAQD